MTAPGITSEDRTPPYSWLRSKTCWQKHISDTYDSAFENWLYGWESAAILTKTFPQHIETSTLPTLLKAYDNIKSCCVGEYVEHRLHITHVAMAAPRWRFESVRAHDYATPSASYPIVNCSLKSQRDRCSETSGTRF